MASGGAAKRRGVGGGGECVSGDSVGGAEIKLAALALMLAERTMADIVKPNCSRCGVMNCGVAWPY